MLSSESRYKAKMEESEMKEDCTKEKANERQRETDDPPKVFVSVEGETRVVTHICRCGRKLIESVSAEKLSKMGTNFPNKICEKCKKTAFGSNIVEVDTEWAGFSNLEIDRVGAQIVSTIIQRRYGVYATEDYTQSVNLKAAFAGVKSLKGGFLVQPHWCQRKGRSLTSSNYIDLSSTIRGFSRGGESRVVFLKGAALDGLLVEALLVESIKNAGIGSEGVQYVESITAPDGEECEIFIKGDVRLVDNVAILPVEMFLGGAVNILSKIKKKMAQLASVVKASGASHGYLLFIDYLHFEKESSKFGLVKLHGCDLVDWLEGEVDNVSMLYDAVSHLLGHDTGSEGALA